MKTRVGKIARLPNEIREQLNRRLEDGVTGKDLVVWLNGLPEVQRILAEQFAGRSIREQNLSEWKHGGYEDWVRSRDGRIQLREMMEEARSLSQIGNGKDGTDLGGYLGTFMAVELAEVMDRLHTIKDPEKRWKLLRAFSGELSRLRTDHRREKSLRLRHLQEALRDGQTRANQGE